MLVYLRDGSAQTSLRAATLRQAADQTFYFTQSQYTDTGPTSEVVTFRLRGWCMLVVFLLPAFTRLGHERQDLLSPCDGMQVCTD